MGCVLFDGLCSASLSALGSILEWWSWSLLSPNGTGHQLNAGFLSLPMAVKERGHIPCVRTFLEAAETSCRILLLSWGLEFGAYL